MILRLYDAETMATDLWRQIAPTSSLQLHVFPRWPGHANLPGNSQILVVDQSAVTNSFASEILQLCEQQPQHLVLATGDRLSVGMVVELMSAGVASVIEKPFTRERLLEALPGLVDAARALGERNQEYVRLEELFSSLTPREIKVLDYVLAGVSNKVTAEELHVSVRTVESRRAKMYRKLESKHVADLVRKMDRLEFLRDYFRAGSRSQVGTNQPSPLKMHLQHGLTRQAERIATGSSRNAEPTLACDSV